MDRPTPPWREPMLAQLVKQADHHPQQRDQWQYERKLDGLRCIAIRHGREVDLWSRNRLPFTGRFPEVALALGQLETDNFVIDGEIVAFDRSGLTSFGLLQGGHPSSTVFGVFDLLFLRGQDTTALPLTERQALLAKLLEAAPEFISPVSPLTGDPGELLRRACGEGWEGLVAKRVASPYRSGRSADWVKLKCTASQELVIGGWTDPTGSRVGLGALLVGYYDRNGRLCYAGKVGTGFTISVLRELHEQLTASEVAVSPFAEAIKQETVHWARPELVAAIAFSEWTADGRLRHPSFQGLRPDKSPLEVHRESPA